MAIKRKQGELESEVLGCLWDRPAGLTSQQILALMGDDSHQDHHGTNCAVAS